MQNFIVVLITKKKSLTFIRYNNWKHENFIGYFLHGLKLKSYEFKKYKSKKDDKIISIEVSGVKNRPSTYNQLKFKALEEGTFCERSSF